MLKNFQVFQVESVKFWYSIIVTTEMNQLLDTGGIHSTTGSNMRRRLSANTMNDNRMTKNDQ